MLCVFPPSEPRVQCTPWGAGGTPTASPAGTSALPWSSAVGVLVGSPPYGPGAPGGYAPRCENPPEPCYLAGPQFPFMRTEGEAL